MKSRITSLVLALVTASFLSFGCGKQETKAPAAPGATANDANTMKASADKAMEQSKQAVGQVSAELTKQTQVVIDKAKTMIGDKKYQEALTALQQVAVSKISPEQKKVVDDLIAQAQKLMASDAGKAIQGVIKK
jgi:TolA-binding protein